MARDPQHRSAYGTLLHLAMVCCDWKRVAALTADLKQRLSDGRSVLEPLALLALSDDPAEHLRCAKGYAGHEIEKPGAGAAPPLINSGHQRIKLAYLSADLHRHATAYLAAGLFELHDRTRFETIAISFGADERSDMRARLMRSFDQFHEVSGPLRPGDRNLDAEARDRHSSRSEGLYRRCAARSLWHSDRLRCR